MWIHSWEDPRLASYTLPVTGSLPTAFECTFTSTSAARAVSSVAPKATRAK